MPITKATASSIAPAAKGDLVVGSATNDAAVLGVGSNNQVLTADSSTATGLKWAAVAAGGKVLQVVQGTTSTETLISSTTMTDTNLSVSITPSSNTSKVLILVTQNFENQRYINNVAAGWRLMRDSTEIFDGNGDYDRALGFVMQPTSTETYLRGYESIIYLDSPATTSAITYKTQARVATTANSAVIAAQRGTAQSSIIALEIGA